MLTRITTSTNNCIVSSFLLSSTVEMSCLVGAPVVNGHVVSSFQPPFICKTSSGGTNAEGWFKSSLESMTERGMRGCSVIVNRLIDNVF